MIDRPSRTPRLSPGTVGEAVCRVIAGIGPGTHNAGSGNEYRSCRNGAHVRSCGGPAPRGQVTLQFPNKRTADGRIKNIIGEVIAASSARRLGRRGFRQLDEGSSRCGSPTNRRNRTTTFGPLAIPANRGLTVRAGKCAGYLSGYSTRCASASPLARGQLLDRSRRLRRRRLHRGGDTCRRASQRPGNQCYALNLTWCSRFASGCRNGRVIRWRLPRRSMPRRPMSETARRFVTDTDQTQSYSR